MTKPRISAPEHLARADRLLEETAEQREEIAQEQTERDVAEAGDPRTAYTRRTGVTPPEPS